MKPKRHPSGEPTSSAVLVLQTGIRSGPWVCRSLARAGFRVVGGHDDEAGPFVGRSLHCRTPIRYPSPRRDAHGFVRRIEEICRQESIAAVLPLDESVLHLLVTGEPSLGSAKLAAPNAEQYRMLCDKRGLEQTAVKAGVAVPASTTLTADGRDGDWPPLPSIVKPLTSATPVDGRAVYRAAEIVRTEPERAEAARRVVEDTGAALVQEFVTGPAWLVDFIRHESRTVALTRLVERRHPRITGMPSILRVAEGPNGLVSAAERLLAVADYEGHGQVQFLERDRDFIVHDVNLRIIFSIGSTIAAGLDVPRLAIEQALGLPVSLPPTPKNQIRYVWLGAEARLFLETLCGRDGEARPTGIASEILLAALLPRRILDPVSLGDPLVLAASVGRAGGRLVRRCRGIAAVASRSDEAA
jgi:biotin carboxylase